MAKTPSGLGGASVPTSEGGPAPDEPSAGLSEGDLLARFSEWDKRLDGHYAKWRKEAFECFEFVAGRQWDEDEKARLEDDMGRIAPVFNLISPLLDAVSGAEIMGRQQVQYYPRQVGNSAVNEIYTKGGDWIRDRCDADQEESEAFRDCFTCGMGWTETRMDYDDDPEGQVVVERVDPLEMAACASARRTNVSDARYIRRRKNVEIEEFCQLFPGYTAAGASISGPGGVVIVNDPANRYSGENDIDGASEDPTDGEIQLTEYQWFDVEPYHLLEDPDDPNAVHEIDDDDMGQLSARADEVGMTLNSVRMTRRIYYRAFVAGNTVLNLDEGEPERLPDGEFTYKCITGKRDRNKRIWYGLTRPMRDPQKWANQLLSQLLAILAASAKGGVLFEASAVKDPKKFEASYAEPGANTQVNPGGLDKIRDKTPAQIPPDIATLMTYSNDSIRSTTGINQEMLGSVDHEQAGVLEYQRKQAAYGVLSVFFDNFRRYRREQGRMLLKYIRYLPDGYLVRIVDDQGLAQYMPMAKADDTVKFDVIVDEAPAGPNQKAQVWGIIMQLLPYLKDANLPATFWAEVARYTPLPASLATSMGQAIIAGAQTPPDPLEQAKKAAEVQGVQAKATADRAKALVDVADAASIRSGHVAATATPPSAVAPVDLTNEALTGKYGPHARDAALIMMAHMAATHAAQPGPPPPLQTV